MMKKLVALLLAASMAASLAACGEGTKDPAGTMGNNAGGNVQETKPEETIPAVPTAPEVGGTILFGSYEQDNDTANGAEPIEWRILDEDESGYFLMSKYILNSKLFHEVEELAAWENSTIRQWLNNDFYNAAFSEEEKASIRLSQVVDQVGEMNKTDFNRETAVGATTEDHVYLLSVDEVAKYFPFENSVSTQSRRMYATDYAKSFDIRVGEYTGDCEWLLRNVYADREGAVTVQRDTSFGYACRHGKRWGIYGIMPVIWVEKDSFVPAQGEVYVAKEGPVDLPTADYTNAEGITFVNMSTEELFELSKELYPIYSAGKNPEKEYYVQLLLIIPTMGACEEYRDMAELNYYNMEMRKEDGSPIGMVDVQGRFLKEESFASDPNAASATLNAEEYAALVAKMDLYEDGETIIVRGKIITCKYDEDYTMNNQVVGAYEPYLAVMEIERLR